MELFYIYDIPQIRCALRQISLPSEAICANCQATHGLNIFDFNTIGFLSILMALLAPNFGQNQPPNTNQFMQAIETTKLSSDDIKKIAQAVKELGPSLVQLADHMEKHKRSLVDEKGADWIFTNAEDKHDMNQIQAEADRKTRSLNLNSSATDSNHILTDGGKRSVSDGTLFHAKRYCGFSPKVDPGRISNTSPGQYPWSAAILSDDDLFLCSGTLISESIVLTTASCVLKYRTRNQALKVVLGAWSLLENHSTALVQLHVFVRAAVLHPSFHQDNPNTFNHDIGLLRLSENVNFDLYPSIFPICIINPTLAQAAGTNFCQITGWPELREGESLSRSGVFLTTGDVTVQTSGCPSGSTTHCVVGHPCIGNQGSAIICLANSQRYFQWGISLNEQNCALSSPCAMSIVSIIENYDFIEKYIWTSNPVSSALG